MIQKSVFGLIVLCMTLTFFCKGEELFLENPEESPRSMAIELGYSSVRYFDYRFNELSVNTEPGFALRLGLEYFLSQSGGKLGVGAGLSFFILEKVNVTSGGNASLYTLPIELFFSYHFAFVKGQLLIPFLRLGSSYILTRQLSNSGNGKSGTPTNLSGDVGVGIEVNLSRIDPRHSERLDRIYGINEAFLVLEYLRSESLSTAEPNITNNTYRVSLRLEM